MSPREIGNGVRNLLSSLTSEVRGMHEAAYLLAILAFSSQVLALVRDRLFAGTFGAGEVLDVYFAAFRIPDLLFATLASLLSLYALLPVLARLEEEGRGFGIVFLRRSLLVFFVAMGAIAGVLCVFAPLIISFVAPGIVESARADLVLLMRILLLQPILLGASNILASLTQLRRFFFLYAVSPLLYNLGIIAGLLALYPSMGMAGLGWGVVLGAFLHLLVQSVFFVRQTPAPALPAGRFVGSMREVLLLSVPRTLTLAAGQMVLLVLTALASFLAPGSIAVFTFAYNLQAVPLTIIGVSYSIAAFPTLAHLFAAGKEREFLSHIEAAMRHIIFWAIPATVLVIVLRAQIVRTILGTGAFDWQATRLTAAALALFVLALAAQSIVLLIVRAYYAAGKTAEPLRLGLLFVVVAVGSTLSLVALFHTDTLVRYFIESILRVAELPGTTVLMLALGFALGAVVQAAVGLRAIARDFGISLLPLRRLVFESFGASIIGGGGAYGMLWIVGSLVDINTVIGIVTQGVAGGVAGLTITAAVLALLRNRELTEVLAALKWRVKGTRPLALEPTDVK